LIEVFTDGASRGNPGMSGAGIYIKTGEQIIQHRIALGLLSNHEAEFYAVEKALHYCAEHFPDEILSFYTDAQVVVDTIEKGFTKNPSYKKVLASILHLSKTFPYFFIKWIPNKQNFHADKLAKQAIHQQRSTKT